MPANPACRGCSVSNWLHTYVGLPFGDGPGEVTCWSLVARVYADLHGIDLPSYGEISARDLMRVVRAMDSDSAIEPWVVVTDPRPFDVVVMAGPRGGKHIMHVGLVVDRRQMLHAVEGFDAAVVPFNHFSIAGRLRGFRRHEALV